MSKVKMKSAFRNVSLAIFGALMISACHEIKTPDGAIPDQYLPYAFAFDGKYTGSFENQAGEFFIRINGNMPNVLFVSAAGGNDLLGGKCDAKIGRLLSAQVDQVGSDYFVRKLKFQFNSNRCINTIKGRELEIDVKYFKNSKDVKRLELVVLKKVDLTPKPCTDFPPTGKCVSQPNISYVRGKFTKQN